MKIATEAQFKSLIKRRIDQCMDILDNRAKQYATADRLHNFRVAANIMGCSVPQAVLGMMSKHLVSVLDMAQDIRDFTQEEIDEKFTDLHNYLYLLEQAIIAQKESDTKKQIAKVILDKAEQKMKETSNG